LKLKNIVAKMAIPTLVVPMLVTLLESVPQDHANTRVVTAITGMEMDTRSKYQPAIQRVKVRVGDGHGPAMKKLKRVHGDVEMVLKQIAEMVMVLVGVATLRGGTQPSSLECQLVAQAYEKLATLVTISTPQDVVSKHALQSLMQQLTVPPLLLPACLAAKPIAIVRLCVFLLVPFFFNQKNLCNYNIKKNTTLEK
jgi:hypothetical protein